MAQKYPQARYWAITLPKDKFTPWKELPEDVQCIKGQQEIGANTGYEHWQLFIAFKNKVRMRILQKLFGKEGHYSPTKSKAYEDYVAKEDTAVENTYFELGATAFKRNCKSDWDDVWEKAKKGRLEDIDASTRIRHYNSLRRIEKDHLRPEGIVREVYCYWGPTGLGKSRRAWDEATFEAYPKDPNTKFWDGYQGHEHVVIDEFTGRIDITHMLRWLDRYPVIIEQKGTSTCLKATKIWITSNIDPRNWYPQATKEQVEALLRRLNIIHFNKPL